MNESKSIWEAFTGCFVSATPLVLGLLMTIATWYFFKSLAFPKAVVNGTAFIVGLLTFQFGFMLVNKIRGKDE